MKRRFYQNFLIIWALATGVVVSGLSSCTTYQYVSPLPATPQFERAGEIQANVTAGINHTETQLSASFLPFLGITYSEFNSHVRRDKAKIQSGSAHLFHRLGKGPIFMTLSFGYDKAFIRTNSIVIGHGITRTEKRYGSDYSTKKTGLGFYGTFDTENPVRIGIDVYYQQVNFSYLSTHFINLYTNENSLIRIMKMEQLRFISPVITFTVFGNRKHSFFYRQSISLDIPLGKGEFPAESVWQEGNGWHTSTSQTTLRPLMTTFYFSASFGFRFDAVHAFRSIQLSHKRKRN